MKLVLSLCALAIAGCGIGDSGIAPPVDRVFLPAGMLVDPSGDWLYVVNSNSDLRYNAGTVTALDLRKAAADRATPPVDVCPPGRFRRDENFPPDYCCRDSLDARIYNCSERDYICTRRDSGGRCLESPTVRTGSFGGTMVAQSYVSEGRTMRRLFVAVRAEPSITFIDAEVSAERVVLRCSDDGDEGEPGRTASCEDEWKIEQRGLGSDATLLPEEPHALALDEVKGVLYVGHLGSLASNTPSLGGVSVLDVCAPASGVRPRLVSIAETIFPGRPFQGVTSLTLTNPDGPLFATARLTANVAELSLRGAGQGPCEQAVPAGTFRDLTLVSSSGFVSAAFLPFGLDLRGFLLSGDGRRGFVLHRNNPQVRSQDPSAVVVLDRTPDLRGEPVNRPSDIVEVCNGPTEMKLHDAGRGPHLFVTCFEGGQVYVVDPALPAVVGIVEVGRGPSTLVFSPTDPTVAYVAGFADNSIAVLDLRPGSSTEYRVVQRLGFPHVIDP